jgi:hypothetical protein
MGQGTKSTMTDTQYFHGDFDSPDNTPSYPLSITSGGMTFTADPSVGTIDVSYDDPEGGSVSFDAEEFGLIAALLIGTADGDY